MPSCAPVEAAAQAVLDARAKFSAATLADLYGPVAMPPALRAAHDALDPAVDQCYRKEPSPSDRARVKFLFQFYEKLTAPLAPSASAKPRRARKDPAPKLPQGQSTPQSEADAAHFYSAKEDAPPYRTD